jgi:lipopolysaccharide exporter
MADNAQGPSLAVRVAKGAGWIVAWRMVSRMLGLVSTVILVRILLPADFGLFALATSLSQSLESLVAVGVKDALIRELEPDRTLYDTGFTINLLRCVIVSICILGGAWPAGAFFNDPRITWILLVVAALTLASGLENIGVVEFRRNLAFNKEFQLSVVPRSAGILTTVTFALIYRNFWALVAGFAVGRLMGIALTYLLHPYRPRLTLSAWRKIIGFSFWLWVNSIIVMMKDRMDSIVIGKVLGPSQVGIYSVGLEIGNLPSTELLEPLATAMFAGFSAGRREGADVAQEFFKAISVTLMLTLPIGVGISLVAAPLIILMFGAKWSGAILLVQVFALLGVTKAIPYFCTVLLWTHAMMQVQIRIVAIGFCVRLALLLTLVGPLGLIGAVVAATVCAAMEEVLFLVVTFRIFKLRTVDLLKSSWRSMAAVIAMAAVIYAEGIGWAPAAGETGKVVIDLGIAVSSGAATFCGVLISLWWFSGRPNGAETMFLSIISDTWNHSISGLLRRRA